jgi:hypothetical protein
MLLTCLKVPPDGPLMGLANVVRHKHDDLLMQHLRNGVSEDSFRGLVDKESGTSFVDCDDGIRSRLGDDTEKLGRALEPLVGCDLSVGFWAPWFRHSSVTS